MYQALYRKYRPANFDQVVGQDVITKTLKNAILHDKLSHAYLFTGPRGTGKTSIAKILAKTINCLSPNGYLPCLKCVNCTQNDQKYNDIIELDAASNNGVDEIREIISKVHLVPASGKYKIYIIDEVHMLSSGAFNALLKTLEEPPEHIVFILATTEPHKVLSTILSRCQRFDFKKVAISDIYNLLWEISEKEKVKIEKEALWEISRLADGGLRDAIGLLDQAISYTKEKITIDDIHEINGTLSFDILNEFVTYIFKSELIEALTLLKKYSDSGKNILKIIEEITNYLKESILCEIDDKVDFISQTRKEEYKKLYVYTKREEVLKFLDMITDSYSKIKASNTPEFIFEIVLIKFCENKNISQVEEKNISQKPEKIISQEGKLGNNEEVSTGEEKKEIKKEKSVKKTDNEKKIDSEEEKLAINLRKLTEIRIENTLANFVKGEILTAKRKVSKLENDLIDEEKSAIVSIILDGEIKAASEKNLIFVYKTESSASIFNKNITKIEKLLSTEVEIEHKVIAVSIISWEIIKEEFNNKKRKYVYSDEDEKIILEFKKNMDENQILNSLFGNIIEYE